MVYDIIESTTTSMQFQLVENGSPIDLTDFTVTLLIKDKDGTDIASHFTWSIYSAQNGIVLVSPVNSTSFDATTGPYYVRFEIISSLDSSKISFVPTAPRDVWNIIGV